MADEEDKIKVGDSVVVKPGVKDPEYGHDIGGWRGRIREVDGDMVMFAWDSVTLRGMGMELIARSDDDGFDWLLMTLGRDEVEKCQPRDSEADVALAAKELADGIEDYEDPEEEPAAAGSYDSSWDEGNERLWGKKRREWNKRDWLPWLKRHLKFPFTVRREEDEDFDDREPLFGVGHTMEVLGIEDEDEMRGVFVNVKEGKEKGCVPLCDVEVKPKTDKNYWHVREYVVWFANR
jgi:hypothetical protein